MTSMWKESKWNEPPSANDRLDSQGVECNENQLEMFEILPPSRTLTVRPTTPRSDSAPLGADAPVGQALPVERGKAVGAPGRVKADPGSVNANSAKPDVAGSDSAVPGGVYSGNAETVAGSSAGRDILDVGVSDVQDLRRLEDSIRWLMSAGATPMPRTAPLPSVVGLAPLNTDEDDSLLLDPDTLFPPRAPRRANSVAAGATKILLVSAVAAPSAYFVADWLQFPGGPPPEPAAVSAVARPSGPAAVAAVAPVLTETQVAAVIPAVSTPAPKTSTFQAPAPQAPLPQAPLPQAHPLQASAPDAAASQQAAVSNAMRGGEAAKTPQPEPATDPHAASSHAGEVVVATAEPPRAAPTPPIAALAEAALARPTPVLVPVKPALSAGEIAMMLERGRVLFDTGDVAAARLFFRRAANAGDPRAAVAMGSTYDPDVLAQRFIRGIQGDAEEAQRWYEKAKDTGQHVEMLAQRR